MRRQILTVCCVLVIGAAFGCGSDDGGGEQASVKEVRMVKKSIAWINAIGDVEFQGSAIFIKNGEQIDLQVTIDPGPPGEHAVHIHETGDCSSPDGMSAGGHWNPTGEDHGQWGVPPFHLGDIGNVVVGDDGTGSLSLSTDLWSMGTGEDNDVLDRAIIVHVDPDDFVTQPTGAAGDRIGCGVVRAQ
jgi:Cu-Zn family superoxide dismutase